jgi:hypothetical protein
LHVNNPEIFDPYPQKTRLVHYTGGAICTYAYAVSLEGARKVLYATAIKELTFAYDIALSWWCNGKFGSELDASCIIPQPGYFYAHRMAGGPGKTSDINTEVGPNEKPETYNIQWSARMNSLKLLQGKGDFVDAYPDN